MKTIILLLYLVSLILPVSAEILKIHGTDTIYRVTLCADVPDNNHPAKVIYKGEPGHVFIILESKDSIYGYAESFVWGFYPRKPVSCILFRKTRGRLVDNSKREYDASITSNISREAYTAFMMNAVAGAKKKYHINNYNCYHYAIELFNAVSFQDTLPVSRVKFPFPFGKGGSPCGLYNDLLKIRGGNSPLAAQVQINTVNAPDIKNSQSGMTASTHH